MNRRPYTCRGNRFIGVTITEKRFRIRVCRRDINRRCGRPQKLLVIY
jgi:hypothetical protein